MENGVICMQKIYNYREAFKNSTDVMLIMTYAMNLLLDLNAKLLCGFGVTTTFVPMLILQCYKYVCNDGTSAETYTVTGISYGITHAVLTKSLACRERNR